MAASDANIETSIPLDPRDRRLLSGFDVAVFDPFPRAALAADGPFECSEEFMFIEVGLRKNLAYSGSQRFAHLSRKVVDDLFGLHSSHRYFLSLFVERELVHTTITRSAAACKRHPLQRAFRQLAGTAGVDPLQMSRGGASAAGIPSG
jgi:hypothetical protein